MATSDYHEIYNRLRERLMMLKGERAEAEAALGDLQKEIEELEHTLTHLAPLAGVQDNPNTVTQLGITEAVRVVLNPTERMSVAEVKNAMEVRGFDFSLYSTPTASIYTILRRLVEANKATLEREGRSTFYKGVTEEEF